MVSTKIFIRLRYVYYLRMKKDHPPKKKKIQKINNLFIGER